MTGDFSVKTLQSNKTHLILLTFTVMKLNFALDLIQLKQLLYIFLICLALPAALSAQKISYKGSDRQLVQFSGFVMSSDSMMPLAFAHIGIKGTNRTATARMDGFFSFAAAEGDTLIFTYLGFVPSFYYVPFHNINNKLSVIQLMVKGNQFFRTVDIYPWGDRSNFGEAFLHTKVSRSMQDIAEENTNRQLLAALGENLPLDGAEATQRYMQIQAAKTYYYGQQAPQNIFNPFAWAEFIKALKRGDFKKKADPPLPSHDY